jgi:acyl phosphate:glycerol-3-phosphate acyltransferase
VLKEAALIVLSYLLGSIPFGFIVGKTVKGIDIREVGSGNVGATNVLRALGPAFGTLVMICDILKGVAAVLVAKHLFVGHSQASWVIVASLLAIVGHTASPFIRFKGGKGVATSLGVIFGMNWMIASIAFILWASILAVTRYVSIASIIAPYTVPLMMLLWKPVFCGTAVPVHYAVFALVAATLILLKHRSNISRLINRTEPKFGQKLKLKGD